MWCVSDGHDDEAVGTSELGLAERVGIEPTVPLPGQQFSRLPDSATLAPLRLVELDSVRVGLGHMYRWCDRLWEELTLGSVIFQSVFFPIEEPVRWSIRRGLWGL